MLHILIMNQRTSKLINRTVRFTAVNPKSVKRAPYRARAVENSTCRNEMTTKELIEKLQAVDPDGNMEVVREIGCECDPVQTDIGSVTVTLFGKVLVH